MTVTAVTAGGKRRLSKNVKEEEVSQSVGLGTVSGVCVRHLEVLLKRAKST